MGEQFPIGPDSRAKQAAYAARRAAWTVPMIEQHEAERRARDAALAEAKRSALPIEPAPDADDWFSEADKPEISPIQADIATQSAV